MPGKRVVYLYTLKIRGIIMGRKGGVNEKVSNAKAHQDELKRQR